MNSLVQIGIVLTAIDKMSGVIHGATDKATHGFTKLQHKISEVSAKLTEMGTKASVMGHGILTAMETPIKAFADLDDASTNLRVLSEKPGYLSVNIYDMTGRRIQSPVVVNKPQGAYTVTLDVSKLRPGNYVVEAVFDGQNKKVTTKFIKR